MEPDGVGEKVEGDAKKIEVSGSRVFACYSTLFYVIL